MASWTCQRQTNGKVCRHVNPSKKTMNCAKCGKRRPPSKRPAHMAALDTFDYVAWVAEFGEACMICSAEPKPGKRLHRDHEHRGAGLQRGILCWPCNRKLGSLDREWLIAAVAYLERAESRRDAA